MESNAGARYLLINIKEQHNKPQTQSDKQNSSKNSNLKFDSKGNRISKNNYSQRSSGFKNFSAVYKPVKDLRMKIGYDNSRPRTFGQNLTDFKIFV